MNKEELDKLWADPANWSFWSYRCAQDPRIIVKKRTKLGWTINFGHPRAIVALVGMVLLGLIAPGCVMITEYPMVNPLHIYLGIGISILMTCTLCILLSRPPKS